ncbi:MAG: DnaB-like helicase C-terminal domain-containing protein [Candidatus Izemoplasmatales bacterium]
MPEVDIYPFDREFRLKILSLMLDRYWMSQYGTTVIRPEFFEKDDEEAVAKVIVKYWTDYKMCPTSMNDLTTLLGDGYVEFLEYLYAIPSQEKRLAGDKALQWAREQAAKIAILDSVDDIAKGNLQNTIVRIKEALRVGESIQNTGLEVIKDIDKWLYELWTHKVRTGWYHIDSLLEGGLGAGELGIMLAPMNAGKSMSLINIGFGAASIGSNCNVVHFTHEMSQEITAKRYAARTLFKFPSRDGDLEDYELSLKKAASHILTGKIKVIGMSSSNIDRIDSQLERLIDEGFKFDLIIDDYPDLVASTRKYTERRFELSEVYKEFRDLGTKYDVPVWGASQSGRSSLSKEVITIQDIAEDIGKAAIADVIVALCQTRDEEQLNACRLFMAKVRDGNKKMMFDAKYYGKSQAIITTGLSKNKDKETDV